MDFQAIRKEYEDRGIELTDLDESPIRQLELWLQQATDHAPGSWFETNAMALATAGKDGVVTVRYVLLKGIESDGISFYTNYDSVKARQLDANPNCSAAIHWPFLGRQIRIVGIAKKTSRDLSEQYFHSRPRGAQLGATISPQSKAIESRSELEHQIRELESRIGEAVIPLPDNWGGYLIQPLEFEFWQGRSNRLHDRIVYRRQHPASPWIKQRLAP